MCKSRAGTCQILNTARSNEGKDRTNELKGGSIVGPRKNNPEILFSQCYVKL